MTSWVVFTDLDETLLDRETYSFEAARAALSELARRRIPIVFCTSKTSAESLELQSRMGIDEPFAYENGGGIRLPRGYFGVQPDRIALAPGRA